MKICLTGGTGFLGSRITSFFKSNGYQVENITRSDFNKPAESWMSKVDGAELLINLAGVPILKKWTSEYKNTIKSSRIETTRKVAEAIKHAENKPPIVISASAVGIYDEYEVHDEFSDHLAEDFLGKVCKEWEAGIAPIASKDVRLAIIRIGVVLDSKGGALAKMLPLFKCGMGAIVGDGIQPFPCIHISDFLTAVWYIFKNPASTGIYNMVAPEIISNAHFSKVLSSTIKRPLLFKAPEWVLKTIYGEGAVVLTKGQKVKPNRLHEINFPFQFQSIEAMLNDLLK